MAVIKKLKSNSVSFWDASTFKTEVAKLYTRMVPHTAWHTTTPPQDCTTITHHKQVLMWFIQISAFNEVNLGNQTSNQSKVIDNEAEKILKVENAPFSLRDISRATFLLSM